MNVFFFPIPGDKLLGATIDFEQLSKEDVLKVLQVMEPFDDKVKVLTRGNLSKSLGDLDQCGKKSPKTVNINALVVCNITQTENVGLAVEVDSDFIYAVILRLVLGNKKFQQVVFYIFRCWRILTTNSTTPKSRGS